MSQKTPPTPEGIIQQSTEIISLIRKHPIQKHVTNIFCCNLEIMNVLLIQNPWIKSKDEKISIPSIFEQVLTIIIDIKKKLGSLIKDKLFSEIGHNKPLMNIIGAIVSDFKMIPTFFRETTLYEKFLEEEFDFKNLPDQIILIDDLAEKIIAKHKDYKKLIKSTTVFPPGELSIIFDLSYMPIDECTVSWMLFSMRLTSFIYDLDKIELKTHHLNQIRKLVDNLKVSAISFDTLNHFFNYLWLKPSERKAILNSQEPRDISELQSTIIDEYPILYLTFKNNVIKIHPQGYDHPSNTNYRGDKITYFGRKSHINPTPNDVFFDENEVTISRKQFQIVYRKEIKKYVLLCISNSNPTMIRIKDTKIALSEGSLFQLCESKIFKVEKIHFATNKKQAYPLLKAKESKLKGEKEIVSMPAKIKMETKFDLLAESTFLSVLELDPPDVVEKCTFRTLPVKYDPGKTSFTKQIISTSPMKLAEPKDKKETFPFIVLVCVRGHESFAKKFIVNDPNVSQVFSIGRKNTNDLVMDSQDLSLYHCQILYDAEKEGWFIGEKLNNLQEKFSFNGTFFYCKDFQEYNSKQPSKSLVLEEGMIIKVGSYEMEVHLENIE